MCGSVVFKALETRPLCAIRPNPRNAAVAQLSRASNVTLRGNHLQCSV